MEVDWDLHAVVRGCTNLTSSTTTTTTTTIATSSTPSSGFETSTSYNNNFFSIYPTQQTSHVFSLSNPFETKSSIEELHELCKPFFFKSSSQPLSSGSFSYSSPSPKSPHIQPKQLLVNNKLHHAASAITPRSKRRKIQHKKVCEVHAEKLSSDIWAWRKYGQKPIKGSPYPRGYYRCSSSKGCLARKQVERNKSDPSMFIVTYTGEHSHPAPTHRNSLAGSTRQKPLSPQTVTAEDSSQQPFTKQVSSSTSEAEEEEATLLSVKSESKEDLEEMMNDDDEENEFELSDMVVTDDFFEGLDELTGFAGKTVASSGGDCFGDPFAASIALPACGGQ